MQTMIFCEIEAAISDLESRPRHDNFGDNHNRMPFGIDMDEIAVLTNKLYDDDELPFLFVSSIKKTGVIVCGAIAESKAEVIKQWEIFSKELPVTAEDYRLEEVTCSRIELLLRHANRGSYSIDVDSVMLACGKLSLRFSDRCEEDLLPEEITFDGLRDMAADIGVARSLIPEIDRIEKGAAVPAVKGHPVHYLISAGGKQMGRKVSRILLEALLLAQRIENRRYTAVDIENTQKHIDYFRLNQGGAFILDCGQGAGGDDEFASEYEEDLVEFCEDLQRWRNDTLMCFLAPGGDSNWRRLIRDNTGDVFLVEIKEEIVCGDDARRVLEHFIQEAGYPGKKGALARKLITDDGKGYLPSEIQEIFEDWQRHYLQSEVYPQYKGFVSGKEWKKDKKPEGSAILELEEMIGLTEAKDMIRRALDFYKARDLFEKKGISADHPAMHMVFTGNPGTAKTSVARLFARIMKENGILANGKLHEVGRADLVGRYVGWTAQIVKKKFRAAKGGVLFIDEAYSLVDDRSGMYGDEAINTIVQEMENSRGDTIVIFAGYPDEMETFLARNPGLRSRIAFHVPFEDYDAEELYEITELLAKQRGMKFARGVRKKLISIYDGVIGQEDFGNGRYARNVLEKAVMRQAGRLMHSDAGVMTREDLSTLRAQDFEAQQTEEKKKRQIGFLASW